MIRKAAGIDFPGWDATTSALIAEVEVTETARPELTYDAERHPRAQLPAGRSHRADRQSEPVLERTARTHARRPQREPDRGLRHRLRGPPPDLDLEVHRRHPAGGDLPNGRVLLAGDAAHVHSPAGGQGIGLGIQDAVNLGWKLAQVVQGTSPDRLLDTYHAERHPAGARALQYTMAASALQRQDARIGALRDLMTQWSASRAARTHLGGLVSGLDVVYDLGRDTRCWAVGCRTSTWSPPTGRPECSRLLHGARPVLITSATRSIDLGPWADRVQLVERLI